MDKGPVPDRDAPADRAAHRRARQSPRDQPRRLYKLLARCPREGPAGLEPRYRRPRHCPARIAGQWEDEVIALRKELLRGGLHAGAATIHYHLSQRHDRVPSVPTSWRILKARGFVAPSRTSGPRAPGSSPRKFPNEGWQADVTHAQAAAGAGFGCSSPVERCLLIRSPYVVVCACVIGNPAPASVSLGTWLP
jgi:hypothetical protein